MKFGRLHHALKRIGEPRLHHGDQEHLLEQADIALARLVAHVNPAAELGVIDQLTRMLGQQSHEFWQFRQLLDIGDIPQVTSQDRGQIRP